MKSRDAKKNRKAAGGRDAAPLRVLPALTTKQSECLLFIFNFYTQHKHFPTHRQITQAMGSCSKTAAMYIDPLVEKGYLTRVGDNKKESRNIRITVDGVERLKLMGVTV